MTSETKSTRRSQGGFTLIELMVTMTVAAALLTTSVPALRDFAQHNHAQSAQSTFMAALALARAEAARRGTSVFVVAARGGIGGNEYINGWDLYADGNGNGVFDGGDGPSIRHYDAPNGASIHGAAQITFNASGYLVPAAAQTFQIMPAAGSGNGYLVTLPPSGSADVVAVSSSGAVLANGT